MTFLPTNSERSERDTLSTIRARLVDRVILIGAIISIPALAASLYRAAETGWHLPMIFQIAAAVLIWLIYLTRRHISWRLRAFIVVGMLFVLGAMGLITYGLSGGDVVLLIVAVVLSYTIIERIEGFIAFSIAMLMLILFAIAVNRHWLVFHIDFQAYNRDTTSWVDQAASFGLFVGVLLVATEGLFRALINALSTSERRTEELQRVTSELQEEIGEHATADKALADSQALLSAVLGSTEDWILSVDSETLSLITYNEAYARYAKEERGIDVHPGMTIEELLPPDYVPIWYDFYRRAMEEGPFQVEYAVVAKTHILSLSFNPLKRNGNIFGISVFGNDITERKKLEADLAHPQYLETVRGVGYRFRRRREE